jgi:hypothetical protein
MLKLAMAAMCIFRVMIAVLRVPGSVSAQHFHVGARRQSFLLFWVTQRGEVVGRSHRFGPIRCDVVKVSWLRSNQLSDAG